MTGTEMITELLNCYPPPLPAVVEKMKRLADTIIEDARQDVIDKILETESASTKLSISHIVAACKILGIGYREARYIPAEDWICDACGEQFRYHAAPSDDERIDKNIHDVCPTCGFQPIWTITKRGYGPSWSAKAEEIYKENARKAVDKYSRTNPYFSRHKAERERAESARVNVANKMAEIDRAKRWDIEP